jgi:hypothetical protein
VATSSRPLAKEAEEACLPLGMTGTLLPGHGENVRKERLVDSEIFNASSEL